MSRASATRAISATFRSFVNKEISFIASRRLVESLWANYDRCIRFKITPVTIPPTHPRLSHNGRSCNAIPRAAPTPAPIATEGPSLFFRSAITCDRLYSAPKLPGRLLLFPGHRETLGFSAAGRAFPDVISTFGVSHNAYRLHHLPHRSKGGRRKGMSLVPSCFIFRYSSLLLEILRLGLYVPRILPPPRLRAFDFRSSLPSLCFGTSRPGNAL
jgi:hypothetical protein